MKCLAYSLMSSGTLLRNKILCDFTQLFWLHYRDGMRIRRAVLGLGCWWLLLRRETLQFIHCKIGDTARSIANMNLIILLRTTNGKTTALENKQTTPKTLRHI